MAWIDLQTGILEEFASRSFTARQLERALRPMSRFDPDAEWARRTKLRRRLVRARKAALRPPCPHCGVPVERCGATAKVPTYCSRKCMRAAIWARWWIKNKDARNACRATSATTVTP